VHSLPWTSVGSGGCAGVAGDEQIRLEDGLMADGKTRERRGGKAARYKPQDLALTLTAKAADFVEGSKGGRALSLYYTPCNVHRPYTPDACFCGTSVCGIYCDFIRELDWSVGEVHSVLDRSGVAENTLVILASDNGGLYYKEAYKMGAGQCGRAWAEKPIPRSPKNSDNGSTFPSLRERKELSL